MAKSSSPGSPGFSYKPVHPDQNPPKLADVPVPKGYKVKPMTQAERQLPCKTAVDCRFDKVKPMTQAERQLPCKTAVDCRFDKVKPMTQAERQQLAELQKAKK